MITSEQRLLLRFCREKKVTRKLAAAYTEISICTLIKYKYPPFHPLDKKEEAIRELREQGLNKRKISRKLDIVYHHLITYCQRKGIK